MLRNPDDLMQEVYTFNKDGSLRNITVRYGWDKREGREETQGLTCSYDELGRVKEIRHWDNPVITYNDERVTLDAVRETAHYYENKGDRFQVLGPRIQDTEGEIENSRSSPTPLKDSPYKKIQLTKILGVGRQGRVYEGYFTGEEARVAIRELGIYPSDSTSRELTLHGFFERFQREVEGLITVRHEHVVRCLGYYLYEASPSDRVGDRLYLITELVELGDLLSFCFHHSLNQKLVVRSLSLFRVTPCLFRSEF